MPCNAAWAKNLGNLSYDLLSDFHPKGEVARAYGAYREADGISERALFIVERVFTARDDQRCDAIANEVGDRARFRHEAIDTQQ